MYDYNSFKQYPNIHFIFRIISWHMHPSNTEFDQNKKDPTVYLYFLIHYNFGDRSLSEHFGFARKRHFFGKMFPL